MTQREQTVEQLALLLDSRAWPEAQRKALEHAIALLTPTTAPEPCKHPRRVGKYEDGKVKVACMDCGVEDVIYP